MTDPGFMLLGLAAVAALSAALWWPRRGLIPRMRSASRRSARVRVEDALKYLFHAQEMGHPGTADGLAGALQVPRAEGVEILGRLAELELVWPDGPGVRLTHEGRAYALRIVRTHRLVERFLADRTGVRPEDWHDVAEVREHQLSPAEADALASRMGHPRYDPHGDPIPTAAGELPEAADIALSSLPEGQAGTITHLEDEPREVFGRLRAEGLALGKLVIVRGIAGPTADLEVDGRRVILPRALAAAVTVAPRDARTTAPPRTLASLTSGEAGVVARISSACRGVQRRRLLDLGVVPGTTIRAEFASTSGDPVAYRVRGALLALRRAQATLIELEPAGGEHAR